jgi:hypothetical protein
MGEIVNDEEIYGVIKNLQSSSGTKFIDLILTNKRILIIRTTSAITGAVIGGTTGGLVGFAVGHAIDRKRAENAVEYRTIEELLASDPKNQSIPLDNIKSVKLKKGWLSSDIWIFPKSGKKIHLGINSKKYYEEWKPILESAIPDKLEL